MAVGGGKNFYLALIVIAVVGAGLIWSQRGSGGAGATAVPIADLDSIGSTFEGYVIGQSSAPVEVTEFADFQCPACARHAILTMPDVIQRLVRTGRVRWVFKDLPLNIHDKARSAHLAAACAAEQDLFWQMHDQLFFGQNRWTGDRRAERRFREYAETIGADLDRYTECVRSGRYNSRIEASVQEAIALGVSSTPTFIIGNSMIPGVIPYDRFKQIVDSLAPVNPTE